MRERFGLINHKSDESIFDVKLMGLKTAWGWGEKVRLPTFSYDHALGIYRQKQACQLILELHANNGLFQIQVCLGWPFLCCKTHTT